MEIVDNGSHTEGIEAIIPIPKVGFFSKVSESEYQKCLVSDAMVPYTSYNNIKIPERSTKLSAGYDFYLTRDVDLKPGEEIVIKTFISIELIPGWFLMIAPRSGLGFKYYVRLANTVGIIDADYCNSDNEGNIAIKIRAEGSNEVHMKTGDKFCQGIIIPHGIVYDDNVTKERNGGFGSTGK